MKDLKRGDTVYLCTKRRISCEALWDMYDTSATVRSIEDDLVNVSFEHRGHSEMLTIPLSKIRIVPTPLACHSCAHRLRKLASGNCPCKYEPGNLDS